MGPLGPAKCYYFSHPLSCSWDSVLFSHEFLIMLESPSPLLGRDILSKIQASVFMNVEPALSFQLIEQNVNLKLWTNGKMVDWAQNAVPVIIKLKDPHLFPRQKRYPLKPKVKERLKPIIEHLKEQGLLIPCNSPCNTPILGVKKSNDKWKSQSPNLSFHIAYSFKKFYWSIVIYNVVLVLGVQQNDSVIHTHISHQRPL